MIARLALFDGASFARSRLCRPIFPLPAFPRGRATRSFHPSLSLQLGSDGGTSSNASFSHLSSSLPSPLSSVYPQLFSLPEFSSSQLNFSRGQWAAARAALSRALEIFSFAPDDAFKAIVLRFLAYSASSSCDIKVALKARRELFDLLKEGKSTALRENQTFRYQTTVSYAITLLKAGEFSLASSILSSAIESVRPSAPDFSPEQLPAMQNLLGYTMKLQGDKKCVQILESALSNPGSNSLTRGDSHMILGFSSLRLFGSPESARKSFEEAVREYENLKSPVVEIPFGMKQIPLVCALNELNSEESLSRSLKVLEEFLSLEDPAVSETLRKLAHQYYLQGDAITAEGLLRNSINKLEHSRTASPICRGILLNSLLEYSFLLTQLQWNKKSRKPEAGHLMQKALNLKKALPCVELYQRRQFPATGNSSAGGENSSAPPAAPQSPYSPGDFSPADYELTVKQPKLDYWIVQRYEF